MNVRYVEHQNNRFLRLCKDIVAGTEYSDTQAPVFFVV